MTKVALDSYGQPNSAARVPVSALFFLGVVYGVVCYMVVIFFLQSIVG